MNSGERSRLSRDEPVHALVRVGDMAGDLRQGDALGRLGEERRLRVARLPVETGEVDACPEEARRRSGLEPAHAEAEAASAADRAFDGALADPSAGRLLEADVEQPAQERPGRQDHGRGEPARARRPGARPDARSVLDDQLRDLSLDERQVRAGADLGEHRAVVEVLVLLGARAAHGRARGCG